jgi:putative Ig domain-containing protein
LPSGVTFVDNGNGTATLAGTAAPGTDGTYNVTVTASNGINPDAVIHLVLSVVPPVSISSSTLPSAPVGTAYSAQVVAAGGQPAYHFSLLSGSLPAGLTMGDDGRINGTATGPTGTSTFTVKVVDSSSPAESSTKVLSLTVSKGTSTLVVAPVLLKTQKKPLGVTVTIGTVSATLTGGTLSVPIAGQTIVFKAGAKTVCTGVTAASGTVTCTMTVANTLTTVSKGGVSASFAGNALWLPASGSAGLVSLK